MTTSASDGFAPLGKIAALRNPKELTGYTGLNHETTRLHKIYTRKFASLITQKNTLNNEPRIKRMRRISLKSFYLFHFEISIIR